MRCLQEGYPGAGSAGASSQRAARSGGPRPLPPKQGEDLRRPWAGEGGPPRLPGGISPPASPASPSRQEDQRGAEGFPPAPSPPPGRPPRADAEQDFPPPQLGISAPLAGAAGLARVDSALGPGITARSPPTYIFPRRRRPGWAGMAAAGGAASRRGPGRPCPFSIEHILSSRPERSPPARAARAPQPAGRQSPAEPGEPGAPEAAPCGCCCCCGPRAAPRGPPEPAAGLGEWERGAGAGVLRARRGRGGARPPPLASPRPCPAGARLPWPLRLGPAAPLPLAAPTGGSGALPGAGGPGPQRRTRRHRTIFSEEQLQALEALFVQNQYPDVGTRERLAGRIRLREERVEVGARPPHGERGRAGWLPCSFFRKDGPGAMGGGAGGLGTAVGRRASSGGRAGTGKCGKVSLELQGR